MKRSEKRILTTHVGSLVRPPELKALAQSGQDPPADAAPTADYIETLQRATAEVVKKQAAVGVDIVSDGEFGKSGGGDLGQVRSTRAALASKELF